MVQPNGLNGCTNAFEAVILETDVYVTSVGQVTFNYCNLKVIRYIIILLSLNCNALHYFCVTFELPLSK